jgi:S1-C subfamily serine protease
VDREVGVEIVQVMEASPAARAGLRPEDLILEVDGTAIESVDDLQRVRVTESIGRNVAVRLYRDGKILTVDVTPIELST